MNNWIWVFIFSLGLIPTMTTVFAFGPQDPTCYEVGNCEFFAEPFETMILPFTTVFGSYTYVIVWGVIVGILWLRLGNTMAVGIVGIGIAVMFQDPLNTGVGFSQDAQAIGFALLAVAIGVVLFQIITVRTQYPSN